MKRFVYLVCAVIVFGSCSSTNLVFISVKEPAGVTVPNYVKSVTVINRSLPTNETKVLNAVHRVLSLESENLVLDGGQACINGLSDELISNNRFENVVRLDSTELRSFGMGIFPSPLNWDEIENICNRTNTNALFSLELFDASTRLSYSVAPVNNTGVQISPLANQSVNMNTLVKTGWRLYDPVSRTILDESYISKNLQFTARGVNQVMAAAALIGKKEAVKQVGDKAGHFYAFKILPSWIRVSRQYFVRGNQEFYLAKRKAQTGNWNEAADIWKKQTNSSSGKAAGRACYNMAIINEINGDIDAAIQWAQKAYEIYRIRLGLEYVNILHKRKMNNELLAIQNGD